jgi:retinol dehydrogenase 12
MKKIALISGPTSGIGYTTALELAHRGYELILVARNETKTRKLQGEISHLVHSEFIFCDLASIASVNEAVAEIKRKYASIDLLINNAGLIAQNRRNSVDGIELTFATNHLGPFVLTTGLIALLRAGNKPRIVHVSSQAHFFAFFYKSSLLANPPRYQDLVVYSWSKLANILFSNELARRLKPFGITSNAVHPGTVASNFAREGNGVVALFMKVFRPVLRQAEQGAATVIHVATAPELSEVTGQYFVNNRAARTSGRAKDTALGTGLWALSEKLIADVGR